MSISDTEIMYDKICWDRRDVPRWKTLGKETQEAIHDVISAFVRPLVSEIEELNEEMTDMNKEISGMKYSIKGCNI